MRAQPIAVSIACLLASACEGQPAEAPRLRRIKSREDTLTVSFERTATETEPPPTLDEMVANGRHWRFKTARGPVHVWIPEGYNARRADTIIYVHGYYVTVDRAWQNYALPTQFAASGINAMFIACEAPAGSHEAVSWRSLAELLAAVEQGIGAPMPRRRIVTIGHSGAWRTLVGWLDEPMIDTVVLLDAVYGEIDKYKAWILGDPKRRLIDIGDDTQKWADALHAELPDTVVLDRFPALEEGIPRDAARARILYIKSNLGHFPLVTNGVALPMVLRTLRAKRLVREPLSEILAR